MSVGAYSATSACAAGDRAAAEPLLDAAELRLRGGLALAQGAQLAGLLHHLALKPLYHIVRKPLAAHGHRGPIHAVRVRLLVPQAPPHVSKTAFRLVLYHS